MKYNKIHWVLVKVPRDQTHRADHRVPDKENPLDGLWFSGYNPESLTVVHSGHPVRRCSISLHADDLIL